MSLQALTYLAVGLSFALYIGIAIWSRAHSTGDFYIAGKGVLPVANGMATAADWMSAASFISMAGLIAFLGYDGSVYLMGWTGGYVLLALLLVVVTFLGLAVLLVRRRDLAAAYLVAAGVVTGAVATGNRPTL